MRIAGHVSTDESGQFASASVMNNFQPPGKMFTEGFERINRLNGDTIADNVRIAMRKDDNVAVPEFYAGTRAQRCVCRPSTRR